MKSVSIFAACSALVVLQGCTVLERDRRDAPWDPPAGRSLFEQLPPWDNNAERVCCGHLRQCQPHQSPRC